jgi:hypothetical protein
VTRTRLPGLATFLFACVAATLALAPGIAYADEAAAQESFKVAAQAYAQGDFRNAALSFEKAYLDAPHGSAMYNAGLAWEAAEEAARAADAYQLALEAPGLTSRQTTDAKARLALLDKSLGRLEVDGPPSTTVTVAHVTSGKVPVKLHIAAGQQDIVVKFSDGQETRQQLGVPAGGIVRVTLVRPAPLPPPIVAPPAPARPPPPPPERLSSGSSRKTLGWVAIGGGVVLGGVGAYFGVSALDARDEFDASQRRNQDAHDRADSLRTWTNVLFVGALALAATGVVVILTAPEVKGGALPGHSTRVIRPGSGSLSLSF